MQHKSRKTPRKRGALTAIGLAAGLSVLGISAAQTVAYAQGAAFPDVPANHWAYQAVQDLADKGYVKGYPNGKFLGGRALTRYEFATVIDRMAQTVADLSMQVKANQPVPVVTPTGTPVTQDDLNKIQALTDTFQKQLSDIQSLTAGATSPFQGQLDTLRSQILDLQKSTAKAQSTADNSYGFGADRKFQISGYVQARYFQTGNAKSLFPQGTAAANGSYNGNYAQGGNNESFQVRRARIKVAGAITPNTKYAVQIDTSGAITTGSSANQQVTVREGYVAYTFGDGNPAHSPTLTAGEFATPFGYELPSSTAATLTPERHLVTSEAGGYGIMANEDYDKGVQVSYNTPQQLIGFLPGGVKLTAAYINGTGRASENTDRRIDQVYRAAYLTPSKVLGVGVSYWDGQIGAAGTPGNFGRKRQLYGADAQLTLPFGPFLQAEYVGGKFEQRTYFSTQTALTTADAPGNKMEGYYVQGGYTFSPAGSHPLSLFASYDILRRSEGIATASDSYTDENIGYGATYNLDKATRLRVYYDRPDKVSHLPGFNPLKIAQTIGEIQVKF
jgi:hypothetical protein